MILGFLAGPRFVRVDGRGKREGKYQYREYGGNIGGSSKSIVRVNHFDEPRGQAKSH